MTIEFGAQSEQSEQPEQRSFGDQRLTTDLLLAALILAAVPFSLGATGIGPVGLGAYSVIAGLVLTLLAWRRDQANVSAHRSAVIVAALIRIVIVGIIGGLFFILGALLI